MPASSGAIDLHEGVLLGYALVSRVATDVGVRALAIKGPTLAVHGLRDPGHSSLDVDILVEQRYFDRLISAHARYGWRPRSTAAPSGQILTPYSTSLALESWPIEIDVHRYFPGFLEEPDAVFDLLWRDRRTVIVAGRTLLAPSRVGSATVGLLHLARGGSPREAELHELVDRVIATLSAHEMEQLKTLARATGAEVSLESVATRLGLEPVTSPRLKELAEDWELNRRASGGRAVGWLLIFKRAPLASWPRLAWRAAWLSEAELRVRYPAAPSGKRGLLVMWLDRWRHGLRSLPNALRLLWDQRHRPGSGRRH